ncbi:MAG TPA: hypothetical protein VFB67_10195 [Candidatus Polarisedimenticolaceae bacterium]|nr:hypothetical protein [Candidatus Polarisedimenticolaceae bacterium]
MRGALSLVSLLLAAGVVLADDPPKTEPPASEKDPKQLEGISILGNQEAPKALVIVPWKGSELGDALGIAPMLDDSRGPVDRDVFLRSLSYYEIRSETTHHDGAHPAPPATAAPRSKS